MRSVSLFVRCVIAYCVFVTVVAEIGYRLPTKKPTKKPTTTPAPTASPTPSPSHPHVSVKSCAVSTPTNYQIPGNSLKIQLMGENGASRFLYADSADYRLPQNGETRIYAIDDINPEDLGDLYWVKLISTYENGFCIDEFKIVTTNKTYNFDADKYFGSGVYLSSNCAHSYTLSPSGSGIYTKCVDNYLQLNTYSQRAIFTLNVHSCIGTESGISEANMNKNVYAAIMGKHIASHRNGYLSEIVNLDTVSGWNENTDRLYELNMNSYMNEIISVSITNNNNEDNICIDDILINDESALHISDNYIGGTNSETSTLSAIFKYPVCKTEVVGIKIDYQSSKANILKGDSTIVGLECSNYNRLISSTCSILQSYEFSKTTSFAISNQNTQTSEYSWGTESSLTQEQSTSLAESNTEGSSTSTGESSSTTNEFSFGLSQSIMVGAEAEAGIVLTKAKAKVEVTVGSTQDWSETREDSTTTESVTSTENTISTEQTQSTETSQGSSNSNSKSSETTSGFESEYSTTSTSNIECSAEIELPPSHAISFSLIFNAFNTTINTYTDLKLTLCSAFLDPLSPHDDKHYLYIDNIPGVIEHKETTACVVEFDTAQYLRNDMSCEEERELSISTLSDFFPNCKSDGMYDGCQCDKDETICWCVDKNGNKLNDKSMHFDNSQLPWQEICSEKLKCNNSEVNYLYSIEYGTDCSTLQKKAIYLDEDYLPRCNINDPSLWDGCQCNTHDKRKQQRCWCVTNDGSNIDGKAIDIEDGMSFEQACVQILKCELSDITYNGESVSNYILILMSVIMVVIISYTVHLRGRLVKNINKYEKVQKWEECTDDASIA